jgi:hypothetical protein
VGLSEENVFHEQTRRLPTANSQCSSPQITWLHGISKITFPRFRRRFAGGGRRITNR